MSADQISFTHNYTMLQDMLHVALTFLQISTALMADNIIYVGDLPGYSLLRKICYRINGVLIFFPCCL